MIRSREEFQPTARPSCTQGRKLVETDTEAAHFSALRRKV